MALAFLQKRETANPWPLAVVEQASLCIRSGEKKEIYVSSSAYQNTVMTRPLVPTAKHFVALEISAVPEVENVFTMVDDAAKTMYVYTVVDDFDAGIRSRIYEKEQEIIGEFEMFDFDFHIISRMGAPLSECVNEPSIELTFQR
jgi:hypothetical protein